MSKRQIRRATRSASEIQQDVAAFIARNLGLYASWIDQAKAHPIDDGGALAGNNGQKAVRVTKKA